MFAHRTQTEGGNRRENESQRVCHRWKFVAISIESSPTVEQGNSYLLVILDL
jgi:hypothetical protein